MRIVLVFAPSRVPAALVAIDGGVKQGVFDGWSI
jgi:hypothetical protein